jgi:hypothetical protein
MTLRAGAWALVLCLAGLVRGTSVSEGAALPPAIAARVDSLRCLVPDASGARDRFARFGPGAWLSREAGGGTSAPPGAASCPWVAFRDSIPSSDPAILLAPVEVGDGALRAQVTASWDVRWAGLVFRCRGPIDYTAALVSTRDGYVRLVRVHGGAQERLATFKIRLDQERAHDLLILFRGPDIEVWLDGARAIHALAPGGQAKGRIGFIASVERAATVLFENAAAE